MSDTPVRFDSLDPTRDARRFDALVGDITRRAAPVLARRRARRTPLSEIESMRRPLLAAAAAIVLFAGVSLATTRAPLAVVDTVAIAEAAGPGDLSLLFPEDTVLTLDDLLLETQDQDAR